MAAATPVSQLPVTLHSISEQLATLTEAMNEFQKAVLKKLADLDTRVKKLEETPFIKMSDLSHQLQAIQEQFRRINAPTTRR